MWQKVAFSGAKMGKKGGGAGDGKITPKNPSLRMRPRGGFRGGTGWCRNRGFWRFLGMAGVGVVWPSTRSGQRELDSVKTDLIAVERNLVSGNKFEEAGQLKSIRLNI